MRRRAMREGIRRDVALRAFLDLVVADGGRRGESFFDVAGVRTPIEYVENVESLCRRHPEMSVCQFERRACRSRGGRVYTANGEEVTPAIEAEYDRKVQRVTFQSDGAPAKKK